MNQLSEFWRTPAVLLTVLLVLCPAASQAGANDVKGRIKAAATAQASMRLTLVIPPYISNRTTADSLCLDARQTTPVRILTGTGALAGRTVAARGSPCLALAQLLSAGGSAGPSGQGQSPALLVVSPE